ncbi:FAD synthase [Penicillium cataractarum]|uniref:FAD synthase n=1 Tax=Penicillium cataractarum TaxID=2100454 RepID=A0A9W9S3X4_9EURO|nr:FAD synthase [Penicillium cataractarum]KAJ5371435.1 FAD synthase [Penicillium cataractarum]
MAQSVVPGKRPDEPSVSTYSSTCAQDHLRPFQPVTTAPLEPRGADQPTATYLQNNQDLSDSTTLQKQNGSAHPHSNGNGNASSTPAQSDEEEIPALPTVIARIHARVQAFLEESHPPNSLLASVQQQTRISLDVVTKALTQYKFSELSVSYNGGKDCLVMLILFLAGLHPHLSAAQSNQPTTQSESVTSTSNANEENASSISEIPAIYALPPDPFPAVEDFVVTSAQAYHLQITKYTTAPPATTLRSSFEDYLSRHPSIRAIFVGTRRTDPHGAKLTHFDRTDQGWPDFMRVHPVIDWHYAEIWAFIRHLDLAYCCLYDMGYTSLGGTSDTHPNPKLRRASETGDGSVAEAEGDGGYLPAYELTQDLEERLGRN